MATATYLADRLQELLDAAEIALAVARTGATLPARRYRSWNPPVVNPTCTDGLLVTYLDTPGVALSDISVDKSVNTGQYQALPVERMVVELWRCTPTIDATGTLPTAAALDAAYEQLTIDMHALTTGLWLSRTAGTLFPAGMGCALARFGDPIPLGPQGGQSGLRMRVTIPINDAGPAI